jgi:PTH1 family peptidyl-tRNA hydrolase
MWLIVGLGNPGREYELHRHNVGYLVAELLADRTGIRLARARRVRAEIGEGRLGAGPDSPRLALVKPLTYMNLSGAAVLALIRYYKIEIDRVLAVHDDLDLPFGQVRAKFGGGEGGHNGLRSLTRALGSRDFLRVRFGIGRPPGRQDPADYVLSDFTAAQQRELGPLLERAGDMVESILVRGLEWTQNSYHGSSG